MATRASKRRAPKAVNTEYQPQKKSIRGKKVVHNEEDNAETPDEVTNNVSSCSSKCVTGFNAVLAALPTSPKAGQKGRNTLGVKRSLNLKRGPTEKCQHNSPQQAEATLSKIRKVIVKGNRDEADLIKQLNGEEEQDFEVSDSDDEVNSEMAARIDGVQETMQGSKDYTALPHEMEQEDVTGDEEEEEETGNDSHIFNHSNMRSIIQETSVFDDPNKDGEVYWAEDRTREPTLCSLWEEEVALYDSSKKGHMTENRNTILKRFSTILNVPGKKLNYYIINKIM